MVAELDLEFFVQEASHHSLQRIDALLAARRIP
jgi:hypothetical protein